uniref:Coiled-coil protein 142 C-terminal domain-containing protein n=1 Tax=Anopheles melas TaxID=34690 RepID=A0A182UHA5_9DIPT
MNTSKWLPKQHQEVIKLFEQSRQLERELRILGKKFATDINIDLPDYYEFERLLQQSRECFERSAHVQTRLIRMSASSADKNVERSFFKILLNRKAHLIRQNLRKRNLQLIFIINKMIKLMLAATYTSEVVVDGALLLCTLHNESVILAQNTTQARTQTNAQICSNSFPPLMSTPKKVDVGTILQIITKQRAEDCCSTLINCLLTTCKGALSVTNEENESDTSSVEILRALTTNLQGPTEGGKHIDPIQEEMNIRRKASVNMISSGEIHSRGKATPGRTVVVSPIVKPESREPDESEHNDPAIHFFDAMAAEAVAYNSINYLVNEPDGMDLLENLIADEEIFVANVIMKVIKYCPSAFERELTKSELIKWVNRGTRGLWTQVGGSLEHVVLWWSSSPLACRPAACAKYLRDWLSLLQPDEAPEPILSTLKGLGETLTVHVTSTIWDKHFRLAVVSSSLPVDYAFEDGEFCGKNVNVEGTVCGKVWSELLYQLVLLSNTCDIGTIANELPLVEQIPVLHRLDHSIHSMRIWAANKARSLCTDWNMMMFFKVVHSDIGLCLEQLQYIRVPELAADDPLEVQVQVCVALRAKLVSEIKENIIKLKATCTECIDVLAAVCRTTSLASLTLCFPYFKHWQTEALQERANEYVAYFFNQIYLPVIQATKDIEILKLTLKIICEAWLDHIYMKKTKFSSAGALNLLKDFDGVAEWINACEALDERLRETLSHHEVLRMCEGVGKLLLRKPEETISILPSPSKTGKKTDDTADEKAPLPPEMFVPNQKRWLELRARDRRAVNLNCLCLCAGMDVY